MSRRRHRRQSPIEDIIDIATSNVVGATLVMFLGLVVPIFLDWILPRPEGTEVQVMFATAIRESWLPWAYIAGLAVSVFGAICSLYFIVKECRERR